MVAIVLDTTDKVLMLSITRLLRLVQLVKVSLDLVVLMGFMLDIFATLMATN